MSRTTDLRGTRVLVTGATGFIGGRLVERLIVEEGATVRALVRNFANVPRIARFPVEMVAGDLSSASAIDSAVAGCDYVIHCAYGTQGDDAARRDATVNGTERVLAAAHRHNCRRVVAISTISVYGDTPEGDLDETAPRRYSGAVYNDTKLDAEKAAFSYCEKGLSVAVVQPTVVYGPFASTWTTKPLTQLKTGRVILVNGGTGLCNAVYVDDVVTALLLTATEPRAHGEAFLVSGEAPVTWREFYGTYESMLGQAATVSMSEAEALAFYNGEGPKSLLSEIRRVATRELGRRESVIRDRLAVNPVGRSALAVADRFSLLPKSTQTAPAPLEPPIHPLPPAKITFSSAKTRVRIDKARRLLGYTPAYSFDEGMRLTGEWARWANLVS
jgi:nucleoside-diphosphate-sugar epimerase